MSERVITAKITRAGMRALFGAQNNGLALKLSHIAIGSGGGTGYVPTGLETGLVSEFERIAIGGGDYLGDYEILVQAMFATAAQGWVHEVGIFTEAGVLFAIWSEVNAPMTYKTASVPLVVALTLAVTDVPAGSLTLVVGAPSVNITIAGPIADISAEVIRLQRRMVASDIARLIPTIQSINAL